MYELKSTLNVWTTEGLTVVEPPNIILEDETGALVAVPLDQAEQKELEIEQAIVERDKAIADAEAAEAAIAESTVQETVE